MCIFVVVCEAQVRLKGLLDARRLTGRVSEMHLSLRSWMGDGGLVQLRLAGDKIKTWGRRLSGW